MTEVTKYAVIDIETGGFSKEKNGLCEIGILITDNHGTIHTKAEWLIKPYQRPEHLQETPGQMVSYKDDAMAINGLSIHLLEIDGRDPVTVCQQLLQVCQEHGITIAIGHNAKAFDLPWVEYFMERFGFKSPFEQILDTMIIAKEKHRGLKSYKLGDLCQHFGIEQKDAHTAGGDIDATWALFMALNQPKQVKEGAGA